MAKDLLDITPVRMASLGDKAEDIPATKKAEKIKANNNESSVVEEEGKEQHQCDNCDVKCEMFNTIKNHITVKHVRVCKYNKFGYCKIREGCKRLHHTEKCENSASCANIKSCQKRQPKVCKLFELEKPADLV